MREKREFLTGIDPFQHRDSTRLEFLCKIISSETLATYDAFPYAQSSFCFGEKFKYFQE